jgi:hypothetical protein
MRESGLTKAHKNKVEGSPRAGLSVPSSSGNTLQPEADRAELIRIIPFSPLFIGEYSSTLKPEPCDIPVLTFQSPLHRGILFNFLWLSCGQSKVNLSVPSSSGNTLQRQSLYCGCCRTATFSPLFIGEYSSTASNSRSSQVHPQLSVPSSSGNTLQRCPITAGCYCTGCLSVPSSSGNTLQLVLPWIERSISYAFQSPLHRGILFNEFPSQTAQFTPAFQSPLHRGILFNRCF